MTNEKKRADPVYRSKPKPSVKHTTANSTKRIATANGRLDINEQRFGCPVIS